MTAADFKAWRTRMGWSKTLAAEKLGIGRNTPAEYEAGTRAINLTVALACAARAYGLPPMGDNAP